MVVPLADLEVLVFLIDALADGCRVTEVKGVPFTRAILPIGIWCLSTRDVAAPLSHNDEVAVMSKVHDCRLSVFARQTSLSSFLLVRV